MCAETSMRPEDFDADAYFMAHGLAGDDVNKADVAVEVYREAWDAAIEAAAKRADDVAQERDDAAGSVQDRNYHEYSDQARVAEVIATQIRRLKSGE